MAQSDFVNYCEAKHQRTYGNANYCEASRHHRSHDHPTYVNPCLVLVIVFLFDHLLQEFVEKLSIVSSNKINHQAPTVAHLPAVPKRLLDYFLLIILYLRRWTTRSPLKVELLKRPQLNIMHPLVRDLYKR
jgi:hypothetical protein